MIAFRKAHPVLRRGSFDTSGIEDVPRVDWHGVALWHPDWSDESRTLAMHAYEATGETPDHVYVIANAHWEPHDFALPAVVGRRWHLAVDTMQEPPADIAEPGAELRLPEAERVAVGPRSVVVLVAR